jgi:hypothetical protein
MEGYGKIMAVVVAGGVVLGGLAYLAFGVDQRVWERPCTSEAPLGSDNPAYAGSGPHPISLEHYQDSSGFPDADSTSSNRRLGPEPFLDVRWVTDDDANAELFVCDRVVRLGDEFDPGCPYTSYTDSDPPTVTFLRATHEIVLREARTGKVVKRFTVDSGTGEDSCPFSVRYDRGEDYLEFVGSVSDASLTKLLAPYVTRDL